MRHLRQMVQILRLKLASVYNYRDSLNLPLLH